MRKRTMAGTVLALCVLGAGSPLPAIAQEPEAAATEPEPAATEPEPAATEPRPLSDAAMRVIAWVATSGDNGGLPFIVVDKVAAEVLVFDAQARWLGATPALLGSAPGDDSVAGIGDRKLSAIGPDERTTPAGRFLAGFGRATGKHEVLWVDYATAISLHPVVTANRKEQRLTRLASPSPDDNRITYGCINIPAAFYENLIMPLLNGTRGVIYILPDTKPLDEVFQTLPGRAEPNLPDQFAAGFADGPR